MVLAVLIAVAAIEVLDFFPKSNAGRAALFMLHQTAGLPVLTLMMLCLLARVATQAPPPVLDTPLTQLATRLTRGTFYTLVVEIPLLGLLALTQGGRPVQPFGLDLPLAVAQDKTLAHLARGVHESDTALIYIMVGPHTIAALWYKFILKDQLLRCMIQCT